MKINNMAALWNKHLKMQESGLVPCCILWVLICQWLSIPRVSISLCLNRLSITVLALPVYLSHWPPLWRVTGTECCRQPWGHALTWPASKLRQSLPRVELPQAALLFTGVVCSDKKAASWSKHTQTKRKQRKDRQKERKKGRWRQTVKPHHRYHLFEKWINDLERVPLCGGFGIHPGYRMKLDRIK